MAIRGAKLMFDGGKKIGSTKSYRGGGAFLPNLLFIYRKTVNISRNLAFGRREKNLGVQKASGGAQMAIRKTKKEVATFFLFWRQ